MKFNEYPFKRILGNIIIIVYIAFCLFNLIVDRNDIILNIKKAYYIGLIIGFLVKLVLIMIFWYIVKVRLLKEGNKVKIIHLILGAIIIMLALPKLNLSFIETYTVLSIAIILKNNYKISI